MDATQAVEPDPAATVGPGRSGPGDRGPSAELARGAVVGRYVVLDRLGAGGMGVVYAAYDPDLDRKVALKVLRAETGGGSGSATTGGGTRLLREAQALAKLAHPNVVAVHDVGEHEGRVWLAMEFVAGETLGAWLAKRPRSWREVLAVLVPAARGLAAAHAKGLVHRDVKPDNVMLGSDGRVRVMDFGLARARGGRVGTAAGAVEAPRLEALDVQLTQAGSLLGTPAYMSPEQFSGGDVGPASDQFSYCVMLWEALYGERPFAGETAAALAFNVLQGTRRPVPSGRRVPRWLRRIVERGLSVTPAERWPDMAALIAAVEGGTARARWRRAAAALAVAAVAAAGAYGWRQAEHRARVAACAAEGAAISEVWNEDAESRLRRALAESGVSYGAVTAEKVVPWLDDFARRWAATRAGACRRATVEGTWTPELRGRSSWCLDEQRARLSSLLAVLARGDAHAVEKAVPAAAGLPRSEACVVETRLETLPLPPAEARAEVRRVLAEVGRVESLFETGAYDEGSDAARALLRRTQAIGWPPLAAEGRYLVGRFLEAKGDYDEAEKVLEEAYFEAAKAGDEAVAFDAAVHLTAVVGDRRARVEDGIRWSRFARIHLSRATDVAGLRRADLSSNLGNLYHRKGDYASARRFHEEALEIQRSSLGPQHPSVAAILNNLGNVHFRQGDYGAARRFHERALEIKERSLGPEHPSVAMSLNNLGLVYEHEGDYASARRLHERALAIREASLGPDHPDVAASLNNLANAYFLLGEYEVALRLYERVVGIKERSLGPEHPSVARTVTNVATVHYERGNYSEAIRWYERALAIQEKALSPDHPSLAVTLYNLAEVRRTLGDLSAARRLSERALAIWEGSLGPDHPNVAHAALGLARIALAQGRPVEAVAHAERALALRKAGSVPPEQLAETRFVLAKALWAAGRERARALDLARAALAAFREAGEPHEDERTEVEAWLAEHTAGK